MRARLVLVGIALFVGALPSATAGVYSPPPGDTLPVWSPDGSRIAFTTRRGGLGLATVLARGSPETRITPIYGPPEPVSLSISPDWRWVAAVRVTRDPDYALTITRVDGSDERRLGLVGSGSTPAWSPDSRRIAYRERDGTLVVQAIDGSGLRRLGPGGTGLAWSPDGASIAFAAGSPTDFDIQVADVDGRGVRTVVGGDGAQLEPRWSPHGTKIAFLTQPRDSAGFQLGVVRRDGSRLRTYTGPGGYNQDSLAWTPDGTGIVYARAAALGLFLLDVSTGKTRRLTAFGGTPAVSPDGKRIAFSGTGECRDRVGIYVSAASGRRVTRASNDCRIVGTADNDVLNGTGLADVLVGLGGDDRLVGAADGYMGDTLLGGEGNDLLVGTGRDDIAKGGSGDDRLLGGRSADVLYGGPGRDRLDGQGGRDRIYTRDGQRDVVVCGTNLDRRGDLDRVWADEVDWVSRDCERVLRAP